MATFSYDRRDRLTATTSPTFSGTLSSAWRADGLLAARTYPGGTVARASYDAAGRPTELAYLDGASLRASLSRSYDRVGSVTGEGRSLPGLSGPAGGGSQTFSYDPLRRVTASALGSDARSYTYDAGSRRTGATVNGLTTSFAYDRADQLVSQTVDGVNSAFAFDAYGNLVSRPVAGAGPTSYSYDLADRLIGVTPAGGAALSFGLDALGRRASRSRDGVLETSYTYLGLGNEVARLVEGGLTVDAAFGPDGERLASATSAGAFGWSLADPHGNVAALAAADFSSVGSAFRYAPYGELIASLRDAAPAPWRFGGRLALDPEGPTELYDWQARTYDPGLAAFTGLDPVAGSVEQPLSLNRYLFSHANPTSLIDPDGHAPLLPMIDGLLRPKATPPPQRISSAPPRPGFRIVDSLESYTHYAPPATPTPDVETPGVPLRVYQPNPANLPWVGMPLEQFSRTERLGMGLAASAAARQIDASIPPEAVLYGLGLATGVSAGVMLIRAGYTALTIGGANAIALYGDDVVMMLDEAAGLPPRISGGQGMPTHSGRDGLPPIVIGEDMDRVQAAAAEMGADVYGGLKPRPTNLDDELLRSSAYPGDNALWISDRMDEGRMIIDIGPSREYPLYPGVSSDGYSIELFMIEFRDYPWVIRVDYGG